ncbi:MAG: hypothetical protein ACRC1T_17025 [Clostridium chrysemydis]|uniref:hypothetical protein n=1 Tax=Clostridium chrysemydis TaxID=2665504 RepID=UPI003F2E6F43
MYICLDLNKEIEATVEKQDEVEFILINNFKRVNIKDSTVRLILVDGNNNIKLINLYKGEEGYILNIKESNIDKKRYLGQIEIRTDEILKYSSKFSILVK